MAAFLDLLKNNRNYRRLWTGQIVSEVGDHFNTIAVFALVVDSTNSGMAVSGVMLARAIPAILAGPLAGVLLDRLDRKRVMIVSDLVRAVVALGFLLTLDGKHTWLLYWLSGLLMFASPFFTSGRASILPTIASKTELHAANSLTQTSGWTTLTIGTLLGGVTAHYVGYHAAFLFNALSFLFSAFCISRLQPPPGVSFRAQEEGLNETRVMRPWHEYREGLEYMRSFPLLLGIALVHVGWATGGGAAQILFTLFGEMVFQRGPEGIGTIWGFAGIGLLCGGVVGHYLGKRVSFEGYKLTISIAYVVHGVSYVLFSQAQQYHWALFFIWLSRAGVAVSSVLNFSQLLRHVPNRFRGRVFSTMESLTWSTMLLSMAGAGIASNYYSPREIGFVAGILSSSTALFWGFANWTGRLPEPPQSGVDPQEVEIHGEAAV